MHRSLWIRIRIVAGAAVIQTVVWTSFNHRNWLAYHVKNGAEDVGQRRNIERRTQHASESVSKLSMLHSPNWENFCQRSHPTKSYRKSKYWNWQFVTLLTWIMFWKHKEERQQRSGNDEKTCANTSTYFLFLFSKRMISSQVMQLDLWKIRTKKNIKNNSNCSSTRFPFRVDVKLCRSSIANLYSSQWIAAVLRYSTNVYIQCRGEKINK